jgi:hypothetical protein
MTVCALISFVFSSFISNMEMEYLLTGTGTAWNDELTIRLDRLFQHVSIEVRRGGGGGGGQFIESCSERRFVFADSLGGALTSKLSM